MKKLLMLFAITIFTISISSISAFAQKGKGNTKVIQVRTANKNNIGKRPIVLNRPVRRVYVTPANRYGRRPIGVRHNNGKHKGWYKGKAKRRVL